MLAGRRANSRRCARAVSPSIFDTYSALWIYFSGQRLKSPGLGGMAERTKAVVLKTTVAVMSPGVRIPLPPPAAPFPPFQNAFFGPDFAALQIKATFHKT